MNVNSVTLQGTVDREPQAAYVKSGAQEVLTSIKLVEYRNGNEYATYAPIAAYGRAGDTLLNTVKGATVVLTGKLAWKPAKEGETKGNMYIMVKTIDVEKCRPQEVEADGAPAHSDDDLPF